MDLRSVGFSAAPQPLPVAVTPWLTGRPPWTFPHLLSCPASSASPGSAEADSRPSPPPCPRPHGEPSTAFSALLGRRPTCLTTWRAPSSPRLCAPATLARPFLVLVFILKACQSFFGDALQVPDMNPPRSSPALAAWAVCLALYQGLADSCGYGSDLSSGCAVLSRLRTVRGYKPLWGECIPSVCSTR